MRFAIAAEISRAGSGRSARVRHRAGNLHGAHNAFVALVLRIHVGTRTEMRVARFFLLPSPL
jgi:hypothetical protein